MIIDSTLTTRVLEFLVPTLIAGLIFYTIKIPSSIKDLANKVESALFSLSEVKSSVKNLEKNFDDFKLGTTKEIAKIKTAINYIDTRHSQPKETI